MKSAYKVFLFFIIFGCKSSQQNNQAVIPENPSMLRLNYDVVYLTKGNAVLLDSGRIFARGLYYDCKVSDTQSSFERFRASSYTEDNQNDFDHLVSIEEQSKLLSREYQYFPMPADSRATVFSGCKGNTEQCYIRWEWQRENFIFVFETKLESRKGHSTKELGREFHEFVSRGIKAF
ncbi:hypothetical protein CH373_07765 [Leptospira perolatii]|uniref:Uncharacterized protein n=1 Tax=Leptospira perolatii TaxID=2023191 RepID=A0A2M9ZPK5_9LEPT|nr:hypothetical protein [Leptospira perolatii]PJZ70800.1 hypothetical protein CH360_04625 [Leptospira perolatii]PJZ74008.1 hypothetical protein CH373_07765 [Leptospira perolatii]